MIVNHDELWGNIEQNPTGILTVIFKPFQGLEDIRSEFSFLDPRFSVEAGKVYALKRTTLKYTVYTLSSISYGLYVRKKLLW